MKRRIIEILCAIMACLVLCSCNNSGSTVQNTPSAVSDISSAITDNSTAASEPVSNAEIEQQKPETPFFELDNTLANCQPIDKSLDCENILLDNAEKLHVMMSNYLGIDTANLAFGLGDVVPTSGQAATYKVISDEIKSYSDFRLLFSDSIYSGYIDKICTWTPRLEDIDGELCFTESAGGYVGSIETWYLGCDVTDDRITGHFAVLMGVESMGIDDAEYLNDENNYDFYDITVQNINGEYLLTDCKGAENNLYYRLHGWLYNRGTADRSLITNERVKPAQ